MWSRSASRQANLDAYMSLAAIPDGRQTISALGNRSPLISLIAVAHSSYRCRSGHYQPDPAALCGLVM
jgi:hypothetical protein